ncbi:unknown [Parabacteroides merdae CAG:48]|nr:unknown [Parabacteroides merdae CAG:48]
MVGIIDGDTIQKDQVLIRSATPYIQPAETFRSSLYARHQLDCFENISLS